jgi:hypothetical protein
MRSRSKEHDRCQLSSVPTVSSTAARRCRQKGRRDCYKKKPRLRLRQHATAAATTRDRGCDNTRQRLRQHAPRLRLLLAVFATTAASHLRASVGCVCHDCGSNLLPTTTGFKWFQFRTGCTWLSLPWAWARQILLCLSSHFQQLHLSTTMVASPPDALELSPCII